MKELRGNAKSEIKQNFKTSIILCALLLLIPVAASEAIGASQTLKRKPQSSARYDCDFIPTLRSLSQEEIEQAKIELQKADRAIELNPSDAKAYYNRALQSNWSADAIPYLTRALELDKNYEAAYFRRGELYSYTGKYELAVNDFTEAIKLNPRNMEAYKERGSAYLSTKKYDLAAADLTLYLKQKIDPHVYLSRASVYAEGGKPALAVADYTRLLKLCPNNHYQDRWLMYRGEELLKTGNFNGAVLDFNRAVRLAPEDSFNYFVRGQAYLKMKKNLLAIADFNRALKYNSEYMQAYGERGVAYKQLNQLDKAIPDLTRGIENAPDYWRVIARKTYANWYYQRALAYKAKGEMEKAEADMQMFEEINSKPVEQ